MKADHVRNRTALCRWLAAVALCGVSLSAAAASVQAPTAFDRFMALSTGAGKTTVTLGSNGTPLAAPGVPTITPDGGLPRVDLSGSIRNPAGNTVPVTATGRISGAQVAKALGRAAAKIAPGIAWAIAIKELASELGFDLAQNPDGTPKIQKQDPTVCAVAPCYSYYVNNYQAQTTSSSAAQACAKLIPHINLTSGNQHFWVLDSSSETVCATHLQRYADGTSFNWTNYGITKSGVAPSPAAFTPSSNQEFLDAVAARSGWPTSSAIGRALADPSTQGAEKLETGPLTVTGPATSPGVQRVTQNTTNNTTKTETTTHNHNYAGPVITTSSVTITNVTNTTTGDTISSETTTETPVKEDPPEDTCKEYPNRAGCAELDTPEGEIPKTTKDVTFSAENLGLGGGSCPPDIVKTINGQAVTVFAYAKPCQLISGYVAPLVVLLSTWIAFLIVMPGGKPE